MNVMEDLRHSFNIFKGSITNVDEVEEAFKRVDCVYHMASYGMSGREQVCFIYMCGVMVFNATFNNISVISWRSVLLLELKGTHGENHRPASSI
jgi:hypothetical protein